MVSEPNLESCINYFAETILTADYFQRVSSFPLLLCLPFILIYFQYLFGAIVLRGTLLELFSLNMECIKTEDKRNNQFL